MVVTRSLAGAIAVLLMAALIVATTLQSQHHVVDVAAGGTPDGAQPEVILDVVNPAAPEATTTTQPRGSRVPALRVRPVTRPADATPPPPGTVSGHVVDDRGVPVRGACITLFSSWQGGPVVDLVTSDGGEFAAFIEIPPALATPPVVGVSTRSCTQPPPFAAAHGIGDLTKPGWEIPVQRTGAIEGRLVVDGRPLAGLCVRALAVAPAPTDPMPIAVEGAVEHVPATQSTATSGPDGRFRIEGLPVGRDATVGIGARCTGAAYSEDTVPAVLYPGTEHKPTGVVAIIGRYRKIHLSHPGATVVLDLGDLRSAGDPRADAAPVTMPFADVETNAATRSADDPVPTCAPLAVGNTVWRSTAREGRLLWRAEFEVPTVVAAFVPTASGLEEVACVRVPAGGVLQNQWTVPAGTLVFIAGETGPTVGNLSLASI